MGAKNHCMLFKLRIYFCLLLMAIMISGCQRKIAAPSRSGRTIPKVEITPTEPIVIPNDFSNSVYTGIRYTTEVFDFYRRHSFAPFWLEQDARQIAIRQVF